MTNFVKDRRDALANSVPLEKKLSSHCSFLLKIYSRTDIWAGGLEKKKSFTKLVVCFATSAATIMLTAYLDDIASYIFYLTHFSQFP